MEATEIVSQASDRAKKPACSACRSFDAGWRRQDMNHSQGFGHFDLRTTIYELEESTYTKECQGCGLVYGTLKRFVNDSGLRDSLRLMLHFPTDRLAPAWTSDSVSNYLYPVEMEWKKDGVEHSVELFSTTGEHPSSQNSHQDHNLVSSVEECSYLPSNESLKSNPCYRR
jgi:hypothetical protein